MDKDSSCCLFCCGKNIIEIEVGPVAFHFICAVRVPKLVFVQKQTFIGYSEVTYVVTYETVIIITSLIFVFSYLHLI